MADPTSNKTDQVVAEQRDIQHLVDTETINRASTSSGATQAGARHYPEPPFPSSISQNQGKRPSSTLRQCTMHPIIAAQESCKIRWPS